MLNLAKTYKEHFSDRDFLFSFGLSAVFLFISLVVGYYATEYATVNASSPVTDVILSNINSYNVAGIFVFGGIALIGFIILVGLLHPRKIPFTLQTIALFILIRSIFVTLTHIGPFPTEIEISRSTAHYAKEIIGKNLFASFFSGDDLFFSGHTGLPFLMSLIYWDSIWLRYTFLVLSVLFGTAVLLGHFHYSIDVFSAFFITYSIFSLAKVLFKKSHGYNI